MKRDLLLDQLKNTIKWDIIIIGGGATGLGAAMDAASRGYKTLLVEQADFAKGTSSKATKLVHGGVRYLAQGDLSLVREACIERGLLLQNAPHLSHNISFVIPSYSWLDSVKYTIGLKFYDFLAGRLTLGPSKYISKTKTLESLPTLSPRGLKGGIEYHDGQFDDSRLALNIAETAVEKGACVLNYAKVTGLLKDADGNICGIKAQDVETNSTFEAKGHIVINATGVYVDNVIQMDAPETPHMVRPSQGVHLTLDRSFLPSDKALMIPKTDDGRVLFAVPWHHKVIIGTTDTLREKPELEPRALEEEINFLLRTAGRYLSKVPKRSDVRSVFAGLRPLAAPQNSHQKTKEISRSHKIIVSDSHLITIVGGKWTTFRKMGQDVIDKAIEVGKLFPAACTTTHLHIHGYDTSVDYSDMQHVYGSDLQPLKLLERTDSRYAEKLHPDFPFTVANVIFAVRNEMALQVEDVLSRRIRLLYLDANAAVESSQKVAEIMAQELGKDQEWVHQQVNAFAQLATIYEMQCF